MTFRGTIDNGRLILDDGSRLPDGTRVDVTVQRAKKGPKAKRGQDPLALLWRHAVATGIPDLADEHDHYAYGTPKRGGREGSKTRAAPKRKPAARRRKA